MENQIKFFYNGIKVNGGKLQKAFYSPRHDESITIYARDYERFCPVIRSVFCVENNSESMKDYFENDKIRVTPAHPFYAEVKAAYEKNSAHYERNRIKREARYAERRAERYSSIQTAA